MKNNNQVTRYYSCVTEIKVRVNMEENLNYMCNNNYLWKLLENLSTHCVRMYVYCEL